MKLVAVSSCPTGIAHTYMAAEALEQAGKAAGHEVHVETQGAAGSTPLDPAVIAAADGVIYAADLEVKDKQRFAGKPFVDVGVKKAVHDAPGVIAAAVAAVQAGATADPRPEEARTGPAHAADRPAATPAPAPAGDRGAGAGTKVRQWLMTGVSYMIPFVAAGGILIALSYMLAQVAWGGAEGAIEVTNVDAAEVVGAFDPASLQDWSVILLKTGQLAFGFLVPVLSGFIAYAIADRPGLVPGFLGGAAAVFVGAGFLGGLVTGFIAGGLALWISRWNVPRGVRGIMPVVVIPLLSSAIVGVVMLVLLGRPIAAAMEGLSSWLEGLSGSSAVLLGLLLGAMMGFDLGGPVNKVAYTFAVTGLATEGLTADATQYRIMAAVMGAGMVAPLALALATTVRKRLFTHVEQENGKAAWLLGASFISEGAIPFAAADPWRVIVSSVVGSAATGALVMGFGSTLVAPHGGLWVLPLIGNPLGFLAAVVVGTVVTAVIVVLLKTLAHDPVVAAERAAEEERDPALVARSA
ncbi:PTS fructose transporter subunit IIC [Cellulomonas wangsupingiae]|uniref:Fructose-specific PTS transporter subunit EIIC n=1 Tax=Cellulomonas wangsupingiae TaxID=2968085 RepID=A0ABY5K2V6_9CELL|nr:fructose-specific PTS transporter subunit EIIC [Cellulomonas wangsupingiae]MCC2335903.1 fructose-specific PTS transporter subunit EIIC [Cellulomonas wangsupingiae]MCM0639808.1 fructose-specific PTS transporter subunit EIIC [Cellulomonas wangsupingiae]UUI64128.1 fructose-specific PTS transporter subunit EIIC [Cellulomonas wangsupingiae]